MNQTDKDILTGLVMENGLEDVLLILADIAQEIGIEEGNDKWSAVAYEIETLADTLDLPDED